MESSNAGASTAGTSDFQDAWPSAYPDLGGTQEYDPAYPLWIAELPVGEESHHFVHGMVEHLRFFKIFIIHMLLHRFEL